MFAHCSTTALRLPVPFGKFRAQIGVRASQDLDRLIGKYGRLLLGRSKRLETNSTGPPAAAFL
jgi:hypothetical protein